VLIVLSPAKTLRNLQPANAPKLTQPRFRKRTAELVRLVRQWSVDDIRSIMKISDRLARETYDRFRYFDADRPNAGTLVAGFAFSGAAYQGLQIEDFTREDLTFAQAHLRILSGLYGVLRPLDKIQPYRLEMGTRHAFGEAKNLYQYWGAEIARLLNRDAREAGANLLINLASKEYFKSIDTRALGLPVLTLDFREERNGTYKSVSVHAKRARGLMTRYLLKNRITDPAHIRGFLDEGYTYNEQLSDDTSWIFTR